LKKLIRLRNRFVRLLIKITSNPFKVAQQWRKLGLEIGEGTCIYRDVVISSEREPIIIGKNCVLTGCALIAHDASTNRALGIRYGEPSITMPIIIGDDCFIGYGSIILMGVTIGAGSIVGAGAVVTKDIPPDSVVAGNPAKIICKKSALVEKRKKEIVDRPKFLPRKL